MSRRRAAKASSSVAGQWMARTASALESRRYFFQHLGGQRVGQKLRVGEELADALGDGAAGQTLSLGVDGLERRGLHLRVGAHLRV